MVTRALTFNHLGTEVFRVDSSGNLGIGARGRPAWTSEQVQLGHWEVITDRLDIQAWLDLHTVSCPRGDYSSAWTAWTLTARQYTMFLLRWSSHQ